MQLSKQRDFLGRAPRFEAEGRIAVVSKTLWTNLSYRFTTDNVSLSGMLLAAEGTSRIPFAENTLLEMTIDPPGGFGLPPVTCLAKVIRREVANDQGILTNRTRLGVRFVHLDGEALDAWEACVERIAQQRIAG